MTGGDDETALSVMELIQVIVPCVAVPVLVAVLLLVVRLCRRHRTSAAHLPTKPPQATRRQLGAPPVAVNNAVGLYSKRILLHFCIGALAFPASCTSSRITVYRCSCHTQVVGRRLFPCHRLQLL